MECCSLVLLMFLSRSRCSIAFSPFLRSRLPQSRSPTWHNWPLSCVFATPRFTNSTNNDPSSSNSSSNTIDVRSKQYDNISSNLHIEEDTILERVINRLLIYFSLLNNTLPLFPPPLLGEELLLFLDSEYGDDVLNS